MILPLVIVRELADTRFCVEMTIFQKRRIPGEWFGND